MLQVWHRVIQIVTNREDIQEYAAGTCFTVCEQKRYIERFHAEVTNDNVPLGQCLAMPIRYD